MLIWVFYTKIYSKLSEAYIGYHVVVAVSCVQLPCARENDMSAIVVEGGGVVLARISHRDRAAGRPEIECLAVHPIGLPDDHVAIRHCLAKANGEILSVGNYHLKADGVCRRKPGFQSVSAANEGHRELPLD